MFGEPTDREKISECASMFGLFPINFCTGWFTVQEKTNAVLIHCGRYTGTAKDPGCHYANPCGRELRVIETGIISKDMKTVKVIEKAGSPIICGAVVQYRIVNAKR